MLVIKKVNQGLQRNAKNLLAGNLGFSVTHAKDKQSLLQKNAKDEQRAVSKSAEVFLALKQRRLEWFQKVDEHEA